MLSFGVLMDWEGFPMKIETRELDKEDLISDIVYEARKRIIPHCWLSPSRFKRTPSRSGTLKKIEPSRLIL